MINDNNTSPIQYRFILFKMKTAKNIIASIILIFGTITIIQISSEESGAGLLGAFCGYAILFVISIWIFYKANTTKKINNPKGSAFEKLKTLKTLRNSGLLNEEEYSNKRELVGSEINKIRVKESQEYRKTKELFDSGILTEIEFNRMTKSIEKNLAPNDTSVDGQLNEDNSIIVWGIVIIFFIIYLFFRVGLGWR